MATRAPRTTRTGTLATLVVAAVTAVSAVVANSATASTVHHHAWAKPGARAFLGVVPRKGAAPAAVRHHHIGNSANPSCDTCKPPLIFAPDVPVLGGATGTPGQVTVTPIFWTPSGVASSFPSGYESTINKYLSDVAAASGSSSNVFGVSTQYFQAQSGSPAQMIRYQVSKGQTIDSSTAIPNLSNVPNPYPGQSGNTNLNCTADPNYTTDTNTHYLACISDWQLQSFLQTLATTQSLPIDDQHLYVVYFAPQIETCQAEGAGTDPNQCSSNVYCGYHTAFDPLQSGDFAHGLYYANMPYADLNGCDTGQYPNGNAYGDSEISITSHEVNEAITDSNTDSNGNGSWMDANGNENGDLCSNIYGPSLGTTGLGQYNQVINGGKYYTQDEFSNNDFALGRGDTIYNPVTSKTITVTGCVPKLTGVTAPGIGGAGSMTIPTGAKIALSFTGTGYPKPQLNVTGLAPAGTKLALTYNAAATLTGTPTKVGTTTLIVHASTGLSGDITKTITIVTKAPVVARFASKNAVTFKRSVASTFVISTVGFPTAALSIAGALPAGIKFTDLKNGTGTLSGKTAGPVGSRVVVVTAKSVSWTVTQRLTITIH